MLSAGSIGSLIAGSWTLGWRAHAAVASAPTGRGRNGRNRMTKASNVILVHGAWADGSSWSKVIPVLLSRGLRVTAVQLPLTSMKEDVATVRRALALEDRPTVLFCHSYCGLRHIY